MFADQNNLDAQLPMRLRNTKRVQLADPRGLASAKCMQYFWSGQDREVQDWSHQLCLSTSKHRTAGGAHFICQAVPPGLGKAPGYNVFPALGRNEAAREPETTRPQTLEATAHPAPRYWPAALHLILSQKKS